MNHEREVENLLQSSFPSLAEAAGVLEGLDEAGQQSFRILQKQIGVQGRILMRLAAAIDGLDQEGPSWTVDVDS